MHKYLHEYGPAPVFYEEKARELFPFHEMSPEEYAAKEAHTIGCFSFDDYIYSDPVLNEWIHSLGDILFTPGALEAARTKLLAPEEIERIRQWEKGPF